MQSATLSFANLHTHGELFANLLRARRETFILRNRWNLPEADGMEYDQYDTPQSRWIAAYDDLGRVRGGLRLTPTTARCGCYSYMIRDAQKGLLDSIPADLLDETAPVDEATWEVTRGFICEDVESAERLKVRMKLVVEMLRASRELGIGRMVALLPSNWTRWASRCRLDMSPAGRVMDMGGIDYQAVWIDVSTQLN
ncbi:acyl-homoserine-lactone synthase [Wenxinia saemankumensis]|uniref:acyl-homoserine-lactone synthase n=1 Tax=Wenxinia saemankumensis TaxID=1447782 RepID=A0A1M6C904_9RHOB|nr:acyl-homoserine-lactone synthase [Wenxinia saemankumensis]SHI57512.1 N-acyl-L-homoserine lactone synthetase [Wenxinia saemankumensis]